MDLLSFSIVAEALHEIADHLSERGLQAGRRANRVEPHGGYSAESDARCACLHSFLDSILRLMSFSAVPRPAHTVVTTIATR